MKTKLNLIILTCLTMLFASCNTMPMENVEKGVALEDDWGYVIARVINPTAGKTIPCYTQDGEVDEYVKLNSDIMFEKSNNSYTSFIVGNNQDANQIVFLTAKKGWYLIRQIGENSYYAADYHFKVHKGKINYIGDIYIDLVQGGLTTYSLGYDWYDLTVKDNFSDLTGFEPYLSEYKEYELVNSSKEYKKKPWICPVDRSY